MSDPSNHQERLHADLDVVERWLRIIHPPGAIMHISSKGSWAGRRFTDYNAATQHVAELDRSDTEGIYLRMQPLSASAPSGGRGRAIDAATLPCLWGDIDIAGPGHVETNLPPDEPSALRTIAHLPEPTYVVRSGGGIYPIWMLAPAMELTGPDQYRAAAELSERWNQAIAWGHERYGWKYGTGVHDLARVLRLPGTINRKAGLERPTSFLNGGGRYGMRDLVAALQQHEAKHAAKVIPRVTSATPIHSYNAATMNPGERPGDVYNREAPWEDALGPDFIKIRDCPDGSAEWAWADDPAREVKLTTDRDGKNNAFFFTTSWPLAAQEPHSKFYVYAHRVHSGDLSAATKDVANRFGSDARRDGDDFFNQYESVGQPSGYDRGGTSGTGEGDGRGSAAPGQQGAENPEHGLTPPDPLTLETRKEFLRLKARQAAQQLFDDQQLSGGETFYQKLAESVVDDEGLQQMPDPEPLVNGILQLDSLAWVHSAPKSFKSFIVLDMAAHIANGISWYGHQVKKGSVVYIVAEDVAGTKPRALAWAQENSMPTGIRYIPFPIQFAKPDEVAGLIRYLEDIKPVLVIVDTQARSTDGIKENDASEIGEKFISRLDAVKRATGACLLTVHHEGWSGGRLRGSVAILGAADTVLRVKRDEKTLDVSLEVTDQKNGPEGELLNFTMRTIGETLLVGPRATHFVGETPELTEQQLETLAVIIRRASLGGATAAQVKEATGLKRSIYAKLKWLKEHGLTEIKAQRYLPTRYALDHFNHLDDDPDSA